MSYHRDYLKRQSIKLGSTTYDKAYKRCKNKLNSLTKKTKEEYFKAKLSNAKNSKESWQANNELLNKRSKTTQIKQLNINDRVITDDEIKWQTVSMNTFQQLTADPMSFVTPVHGN
jgi:hypothetical protein